jgi:nucleoside-diphosphate-sugar epimerase
MNKTVIVFGATGGTGQKICEQLSERKIQHCAFVRKGSDEKITSKNTQVMYGNVLNEQDIENLLKTHECTDVVIALGSRDLKKSNIRSEGTKNIVDALNKRTIKSRIHVVSALGVRDSWNQLNWFGKLLCKVLLKNTMNDHEIQEKVVIESNNPYHIVRPVGLTDGMATGNIINQTEGFLPNNDISRADVAKYVVDSLLAEKTGFSSICKGNT